MAMIHTYMIYIYLYTFLFKFYQNLDLLIKFKSNILMSQYKMQQWYKYEILN